jgi:hypothetical protein
MEIKVLCPCGAKYQFPVEPVNGMLPQAIRCPVCSADNTNLGNEAIRQQLAPRANVGAQAAAAPGGLRLQTAATPPVTVPAAPPIAPVFAAPPVPRTSAPRSEGSRIKRVSMTVVSVVLVLFGIWVVYNKAAKHIRGLGGIIAVLSGKEAEELRWTLPYADEAVLLVKHDNHTDVAEALSAASLKLLRAPLQVRASTPADEEDGGLFVYAAHNGAVMVEGGWDWSDPKGESEAASFAGELSRQLNTIVVMALMGDDGDAGVYAVFEEGERKFRLKRWYQITGRFALGLKEFVERDGEEWARQHGYVPDPDKILTSDTDKIPFEDANQLTLNLGIDLSEMPEEMDPALVLEPAPSGRR